MFKKTLFAIVTIALLAMPALPDGGPFSPRAHEYGDSWPSVSYEYPEIYAHYPDSGVLAQEQIPVMMVIDKTVTLDVEGGMIMLHRARERTWMGSTTVHMTNNFPVTVTGLIVPKGPWITKDYDNYEVDVSRTYETLNFNGSYQVDAEFFGAAPAPVGIRFYVGALINHVDIAYAMSDPAPQQVAEVLLTVHDAL